MDTYTKECYGKLQPLSQRFLNKFSFPMGVKLYPKEKSAFMKLIRIPLRLFNKNFDGYITTIGKTIYLPAKFMEGQDIHVMDVLAHETKHIYDSCIYSFLYEIGYLFPQILALPFFIASLLVSWYLLIPTLICLAPLPAYFRYLIEMRAYRVNLMVAKHALKYDDVGMMRVKLWITKQMTERWYYFTWPFKQYVMKNLEDESFMSQDYYQNVLKFLKENGY